MYCFYLFIYLFICINVVEMFLVNISTKSVLPISRNRPSKQTHTQSQQ